MISDNDFNFPHLSYNLDEMLGNYGARVGASASEAVRMSRRNIDMQGNRPQSSNQGLSQGQLNHLNIQRPCEQLPPNNIRGDVQSHIDAEEFNNVEGVCSGLVPQQRIPLPN